MADTTRRLGLHLPTGGDPADVPSDVARLAGQIDEAMLTYDAGTLAGRPTAGVAGRFYYATDVGTSFLDTGSEWIAVAHQPGDIAWTARSESSRLGWLPCDGAAVSRTTYAALFAAIGTTQGAGNGSTTFNVPDAQGRTLIGVGTGAGLTARALGAKVGAETHRLTTGEMPAHVHSYTRGSLSRQAVGTGAGVAHVAASETISTGSQGGGGDHNNMPPSLALRAWVKV